MKTKVLVIGSTGFIGTRLTDALAQTQWAEPLRASRRTGIDATDPKRLKPALQDVDAVVNCLSGQPGTISESARLLFELAQQMPKPPRIIHMSSIVVYGSAVGEVDETAPVNGDASPYAAAKAKCEAYAKSYPRSVVLRPGIIYGPGSTQWSGRIASWLRSGRIGDLGQAGEGVCNLVYSDDTVQVILQALQEPSLDGQVFNLTAPSPPTWNEYFDRYAKALKVRLQKVPSSALALEAKVLAAPLKVTQVLAGKVGVQTPEPMPGSLLTLFKQKITLRNATIDRVMHPKWTPLDEGLARAAAWLDYQSAGAQVRRGARPGGRASRAVKSR